MTGIAPLSVAARSPIDLVVWEAGQSWAAALLQLSQGSLSIRVSSEYDEICRLAAQNPYAAALWEVNLSNWEDRARRTSLFLRNLPCAGVVISLEGLTPDVCELFRELGATWILNDRLDGVGLLRSLERQRQITKPSPLHWRAQVGVRLPWLDQTSQLRREGSE